MRSLLSDMLAVWLKAEGVSGCLLESVLACILLPDGQAGNVLEDWVCGSPHHGCAPVPGQAVYDDRKGLWNRPSLRASGVDDSTPQLFDATHLVIGKARSARRPLGTP